ncbi:MAG: transcription termination factor NusA [Candidatus Sumerlaeaceae bacterium]
MNAEALKALVKQLSKEKELDVQLIKQAIEEAIIAASRRALAQYKEPRAELDVETGVLHLWVKKTVVQEVTNPRTMIALRQARKINKDAQIGDEIEVDEDPSALGHVAAQNMRQILAQKIQDAEREKVVAEWSNRIGDVVNAVVQRVERDGTVVVSLGRVEALLPRREIPPMVKYQPNDRIKVLVTKVDPSARGPMITVSRTSPELVSKLFEQEVPEIADGTVKIVRIARDPGVRTKIAVESTSKEVDPVGACVGLKGSRVQMIVRELDNEKIDVVAYSPKLEEFVARALVPAEIASVRVIPEERKAIVIVKEQNLSLAIGKRGQNARLAAKLTGLTLDIHPEGEEQKLASVDREQVEQRYLADLLSQKDVLEEGILDKLASAGIKSVAELTTADPYKLSEIFESDVDWAQELIEDAKNYLEQLDDMRKRTFGSDEN